MERLFRATNGVLTVHTEWLSGVRLRHLVPSVQYMYRIVRVGGCPAIVAKWQSTGSSSQRCPGFNSRQLPAFFAFLYSSIHNIQVNLWLTWVWQQKVWTDSQARYLSGSQLFTQLRWPAIWRICYDLTCAAAQVHYQDTTTFMLQFLSLWCWSSAFIACASPCKPKSGCVSVH